MNSALDYRTLLADFPIAEFTY